MASWGGEGPAGKSCRECHHWAFEGYLATGIIKGARCRKTATLNAEIDVRVPDFAPACKYFMLADDPPPRFKEGA